MNATRGRGVKNTSLPFQAASAEPVENVSISVRPPASVSESVTQGVTDEAVAHTGVTSAHTGVTASVTPVSALESEKPVIDRHTGVTDAPVGVSESVTPVEPVALAEPEPVTPVQPPDDEAVTLVRDGEPMELCWKVGKITTSKERTPLRARLAYKNGGRWDWVTREMVDAGQVPHQGKITFTVKKLTRLEAERIERIQYERLRVYLETILNRRHQPRA